MSPIANQSWLRNVGIPLAVIGSVAAVGGAGVFALVRSEDRGVHEAWAQRQVWLTQVLAETRADLGGGVTADEVTTEVGRRLKDGPRPAGMPDDVRIEVNAAAGVIHYGAGATKCRSLLVASGEVTHC